MCRIKPMSPFLSGGSVTITNLEAVIGTYGGYQIRWKIIISSIKPLIKSRNHVKTLEYMYNINKLHCRSLLVTFCEKAWNNDITWSKMGVIWGQKGGRLAIKPCQYWALAILNILLIITQYYVNHQGLLTELEGANFLTSLPKVFILKWKLPVS